LIVAGQNRRRFVHTRFYADDCPGLASSDAAPRREGYSLTARRRNLSRSHRDAASEVNSPLQHQTVTLPPRGCFFWLRIRLSRRLEYAGGDTRPTTARRRWGHARYNRGPSPIGTSPPSIAAGQNPAVELMGVSENESPQQVHGIIAACVATCAIIVIYGAVEAGISGILKTQLEI